MFKNANIYNNFGIRNIIDILSDKDDIIKEKQ